MQWSGCGAVASDCFGLVAHDREVADIDPTEHVAQVVCLAFDHHRSAALASRYRFVIGPWSCCHGDLFVLIGLLNGETS